jgi:hypothetical protein
MYVKITPKTTAVDQKDELTCRLLILPNTFPRFRTRSNSKLPYSLTGEKVSRFKWPVRKLAEQCDGPARLCDLAFELGVCIGFGSDLTGTCGGDATERLCAMVCGMARRGNKKKRKRKK